MGDRGDVPGVTGQGACDESIHVVDKVGDDHFDDLGGKLGGGGRACGAMSLRRCTCGGPLLDLCSTSVPDSLSE